MNILIFIAGLAIGISVFVYLLNAYERGKAKVKEIRLGKTPQRNSSVTAENIAVQTNLKRAPGERMCPLCRSSLSKYEALYASQVDTKWGPKIMIHGCRYCYKPDEDPDQVKKSAY